MIDDAYRENVQNAIDNHDFETFIYWYKKLNSKGILEGYIDSEFNCFIPLIYLPDSIYVPEQNDYISVLDRNNFNKITFSESECG
jgi:hypothetical protein